MRYTKLLFLHPPVTFRATSVLILKYNNSYFEKLFPCVSYCVSFRVFLLCFLFHLFHLFPDISAHNVTSLSSTGNRSFSPSKRQIDDLLGSSTRGGGGGGGVLNGKDLDVDGPIQPANNEQPYATFVYTALINDKVQLPCDITPPTSDDQMLLVLWYKDDQLAPILTLDGRKNSADSSATISLPYLQGRAFFTAHGRPAHLLIDPVAASDEGDYRCRVDFRKARTVNTVISLKVITPPQVPKILDVDGNPLSGVVGPYNEGDELTLRCLTKGGKPRPSLIWWRDYAIIDDSFEFDDRDATTNELTTTLVRHHLLALVMCQAINSNITTPASTSITLDINLKPLEVRITQLTPILVSGSEALFECNTAGSRPMPAIYWIFNGQKYETRIHGEQQTTSTLTLRMDRTHRGLVLECVVENLRIPSSTIRDQLTLDVQYAPQLSLHLGTPSLSLSTVQEGMDIYFDCHVDSNPPPTTPITWLFNGQPLLPEPGVIESNQSLVLQRVPRWRNGTYQCQCANHQGTVISNTIDLEVKFAPVCRTTNTLIFGLNLGELVQISCDVDARPEKVSFSWKFERTTNLANFVQINDTKSLLEYQPRLRDQFGLIECTAKNDIGMQREPCRYLIAPLAGPFFPYNCAVANQSDSTLSIRCDGSIATNTSAEAADNPGHFRPSAAADLDDQEEEDAEGEDAEETADQRIKYHPQKARRKYPEPPHHHSSSSSSNLSTSDIYALYFAPDNEEQQSAAAAAATEEDVDSGSGQRPGSPTKMTYRNGGPLGSLAAPGKMSQHQLTASASLLLNELVPKFNSYSINSSPHLFAYPPTYYVCEIYALLPRMTLIKNVTIDAVGRRIMNPLNGSFSFLVDALPPNTPLRVNIYARNARKRSPVAVELEARTLRAAERRIDYAQQGGGEHHSGGGGGGGDSLAARGRKASFFEELYGGYGRFRSKHLVVGLLIGAVAVAVFVAILLIVIASIRNKTDTGGGRHLQGQETRLSSFDAGGGGGGGKQKMGRKMAGRESSLRHSATLHLEDFKETAFMTTTDEETGEALHGGTVVTCSGNAQSKCSSSQLHSSTTLQHDIVPGGTAAAIYGDYAHYGGLDGDDDSSMRSDHQLIQQASNTLESSTAINSSNNSSNGSKSYYHHHHRSRGPPSYFDLEQSVGQSHHLTSDTSVPRAFVNLISSPVGSAGTVGTAVVEAKPDLIQTATIYSNAGAKDPSSAIFDTISFESHHGTAPESATASAGTAYLNELGPTMIAVTGEQISGNIIHFSSPMRKFEPNTATVLTSAHGHGTLHRRYIGHSYLANDGPSPSSSSSNATTSSLFATLPRGTSGASTNAVLSSAHAHLSGSNMLIDAGNKQQQSYIYIQHLAGPETESPANDGT